MSRAVVIGYGSIGQRHVRVLSELGHEVAVVSRRAVDHRPSFSDLSAALQGFAPDYVVIATETSDHRNALSRLSEMNFQGTVLVEKPLFEVCRQPDLDDYPDCYVAYNLRFHPHIEQLRSWLGDKPVVSANIYVGQHLSTWRPGRDYKETYSARPELGGGALRDLSHELDYALWLFGPWQRLAALGGTSGALGIDADDQWSILAECERCSQLSVSLSYLDREPRRHIVVNTQNDTAFVDLVAGCFSIGSSGASDTIQLGRDETYFSQHQSLLSDEPGHACTYHEGYHVVRMIDAIEKAANSGGWVRNEQA